MNRVFVRETAERRMPWLDSSDIVKQLTKSESESLPKGSVILVRSDYKYEKYGDHFSLVVGGKIQKERGVRPNLVTLPPTKIYDELLSDYQRAEGAVILLLTAEASQEVMDAYGLHLSEGEITSL